MLDANLKTQLDGYLKNIVHPVELVASLDASDAARELDVLLDEIAALSPKISRATGNDAGDYMVVGPDWKGEKPAGIKQVFRSSSQFALGVYRTQLFNPDDMPNVEKVQAGYKVQPLSAYLGQPAPPAAPADARFPQQLGEAAGQGQAPHR